MADFVIFADATADVTDTVASGIPDVQIIPMRVEICGKEYTYGPDGDLTAADFYAIQRQGNYAKTSQINPSAYASAFEPVLRTGKDILCLCFSSGMSATFQSAQIAATELEEKYPDRRICCIDSLSATAGEVLLLRQAVQMRSHGAKLEEVAVWLEENRLKVCHWFAVDTFDHLHHGGRVSKTTAVAGTVLQIKPILHITEDGHLENTDKPRGRKKALAALLSKLEQGWQPELGKSIMIVHADCLDSALELRAAVADRFTDATVEISDLGPVLGAHGGPGLIAAIYWGNNR